MPIQKDGKTYYTMGEVSDYLDERIDQRAHRVADKIIRKQQTNSTQEYSHV